MILKKTKQFIKEHPSFTVLFSLLFMIFVGALILALPICRDVSINIIDLFFISTSLITVTGLKTIPFASFSNIGQIVILVLMQIGGLGLMTMSLFIISLFVDLDLYTQILAREILSIQNFKDTKRILFFIIKLTFICEMLGAIATFFVIKNDFSFNKAIFLATFHSVTSFCNVGISLFKNSTIPYSNNSLMVITTTLLILFGSLGFVTWYEFSTNFIRWRKGKNLHKISWNTALILKAFFITWAITSILFWLIERQGSLANMTPLETLLNVILIGVSSKSTGFLPMAINILQPASILLIAMTSFIGTAPSSTGSGIKTSSLIVLFSIIRATLYGRTHAEVHGRTIPKDQVYKAMTIISMACCWIFVVTFCLLITEKTYDFMNVLFETISAFSNNGLSLGITPWLSIPGKIFIMATMIIGRIGTLLIIIGMTRSSDNIDFSYPEERIILG